MQAFRTSVEKGRTDLQERAVLAAPAHHARHAFQISSSFLLDGAGPEEGCVSSE